MVLFKLLFLVVIVCGFLGIFPAAIASGKGRSFLVWWLFGALLFVVALPMAIALPYRRPVGERMWGDRMMGDRMTPATDTKRCPFCAEIIRSQARVCRFCNRDLPPPAGSSPPPA